MIQFFIVTYFIAIFAIVFYSRKRSKGFEGFSLANKSLSTWVLIATIVATFYGSSAIIGGVGLAYALGMGVLWFIIPFYIGNLALIPFLKRIKEHESVTLPDFLGKFYGNKVISSSAILVGIYCLVPESIIGAGKILTLLFPLSLEQSMVLVTSIIALYTIIGGMRSVAYSDVLQFFLLMVGMWVLAYGAFGYAPDFVSNLPSESFNPVAYIGPQEILLWCILLFFLPITSAPLYQRFFSSNPKADIRKALLVSVLIWFLIDVTIVISGLVASTILSVEDPDFVLLELTKLVLSPELQAVVFIGLLSALMSTADSFLHAGGTSLAYDVLGRLTKLGDNKLVQISRLFVVMLAVTSLVSALIFQEVIPALIFFLSVWVSAMTIPTLSILLDKPLKERTILSCIFLGASSTVLWKALPLFNMEPLFIGLIVSLVIALVDRL
ncbi:MAG: sodium:solute symporter family protein [Candidatus Altiarchaeota archaeon]|nr:sodium:solute symporter family protein [Candidatus Altiarchaeota archaeon]